jgi:hypothetical protein
MSNPRMRINATNLERTFSLLNTLEICNLKEKVREVILLLGDCFPSGTRRDDLGITHLQMCYIVSLAGLDREEALELCDTVKEAEGMDSNHASHIINRLKKQSNRAVV